MERNQLWRMAICAFAVVAVHGLQATAQPTITTVNPSVANTGATVGISGTNFNTTLASNIVYFGATKATVTGATTTSLNVTVPIGATHMPISVLNAATNLTAHAPFSFLPTFTGLTSTSLDAPVNLTTGSNPFQIAMGDLDGDGKADIVVSNFGSSFVSVYRNTSPTGTITAGSFTRTDLTLPSQGCEVVIADVDGDGKPEILVGSTSATFHIFRNLISSPGSITTGSFARTDHTTGGSFVNGICVRDLDGNGKPDIVTSNFSGNNISVFRNNSIVGTISLATKVDFATGTGARRVDIADIDGDGKQDIVLVVQSANTVAIFRNVGTGSFTSGSLATRVDFTTLASPHGMRLADMDGDGKQDVVVSYFSMSNISCFKNIATSGITTSSLATRQDFTALAGSFSIAIGDFNGDGKPDIVSGSANAAAGAVSVFENTSSGGTISLAAKVDYSVVGTNSKHCSTGDVDGDGKTDILVANQTSATFSVLRNAACTPPAIGASGGGTVCEGTPSTLTATGGITYSWAPAAGLSATTGASVVATPAASTVYTITGNDGTCNGTATVTVNVIIPSIAVSGGGSVCAGGSRTLTATGGSTYSWAPSESLSSSTDAIVTATPSVSATYTVTGNDGTCTRSVTVNVTVNTLPTIGASGGATLCAGESATLHATGGSTYSWLPATGLSSTTGATVTATPATTITYTVTGSNGICTNTATATVSVNPLPTIGVGTESLICPGGSAALTATGGSTYSWAPSGSLSASTGASVNATPSSTTTYTVTGSNGTCTNTATVMVSVNPLPSIGASGGATLCAGESANLTATGDATYSWLPSTGLSATSGSSVTATPSTTITYTVTGGTGSCTNTATVTVSVNPVPNITGSSSVCLGLTVTLNGSPASGTWLASNSNATVSSDGVVTGVTPGAVTIRYTLPTGCYDTHPFDVNNIPTVSAADANTCLGSSATLTGTGASSYSWSPSTGLSATTGTSVTATPTVTTTYTVIGTNGPGCADTTTATVNVAGAGPISAGSNVAICSGLSTVLSATGTATSYTWSPASSLSASTGATVTATPTVTTTYTLTGTSDFCVQTRTVTVSVNAAPSAITGSFEWCKNTTNSTLSTTPTGGTWSSSTPSVASINSTTGAMFGVNAGTTLIVYTKSGCTATKEVTVVATPTISSVSSICAGMTTTLTSTVSGGVWSSSADTIATIDASTGLLTAIEEGVATISYAAGASCVATRQVTVGLPPAFTSGPWVCLGQSMQIEHPITGGTWSSSNPARASVDATTGVVHGITLGSFYITYTLASGCARTQEMSVQNFPLGISGTLEVCEGQITNLSNENSLGTWSSSDETVAYVSPLTGAVYGLAAGTTNITYRFHSCINSEVVTVHGLPSTIIGGDDLCVGTGTSYTSTPASGTWSSSNTSRVTIGLSSGTATGVSPGSVTLTYTSPMGCATTKSITVNPQPGALSGLTTVSVGNTTTITSASGGGTWSSSIGSVATVGTALSLSTTVSGLLAGATTVTATNTYGCVRSIGITVIPAPAVITGDAIVCPGSTISLSNTVSGGTWSSGNTSKATVSNTGIVTGVAAGTVNISYKTGATSYAIKEITVNSAPVAITGPSAVCVGSTISLSHAETGGTWSSSNPARASIDASTGALAGLSAGGLTITYRINSGCSKTYAIMVNAAPAAISGASTLCQGSTTLLTNSTTGGTWSSSNTSVASVPSTPGNVTGVSAGAATITYKITATNCYATRSITVNEQPTTIGGGANKLCIGGVATYTSTPTGGTWTSSMPARASVDATTGQVTAISAGTLTLSYSLSTGCYKTLAMTINPLPAAIGGTAAVCQNATTTLSNATTGGTWSSSAMGTASVTATGVVTGASAGMADITYKLSATGCQSTRQVTVNGLPSAISGANQLCVGSNSSYTSTPTSGTWLSSAPTRATIGLSTGTATGLSAGVTILTYTAPATGCRITKQITVNTSPAAITGLSTVCAGNSVTLSSTTLSQTWSSTTSAATITPISSGAAKLMGISTGTSVISYANASGCAKTLTITVAPAVPAVTGDMIVCPTRTIALSTTATGGTWSSALTTKATVNTSGVVTGVSAGTVNISYTVNPGCNTVANVTVNAVPAAITGPTSVCPMDMIDLNHATAGGTWSASNGNVSVNASNGEVTGVTAGSSTISYNINSGCFVTSGVTVKASPAAISGSLAVATGATSALTNSTTGGTWSSSNTDAATIASTTGIMSGVGAGTSIITYRVTTTQCYVTAEATVTELPAGRQMETESTKNILIYPNPTTGVLTIDASSEGVFTLYTLDGKQLQQYRTEAPSTSISIPNNLAAGVYMCRFEGVDGSSQIVRIVYAP